MRYLQSKLPDLTDNIFTAMSSLALKHHAINLGQGFPDFSMSPVLIELVAKAMHDGRNQYAHKNGAPELRNALSEKVFNLYQKEIDPNREICITPGATYAIYIAMTAILQPGDEVIVFEPSFDSYLPNIELNGAKPILVPLEFPQFTINWENVEQRITPSTRMIMINTPHNPTGTTLSAEDMGHLQRIAEKYDLIVLSDEVYEHIIFDGKTHESVLKYPGLFQRSFTIFSLGKSYHCTGWKTGYCIAPENLMKEFVKVHQFTAFSCFSPVQYAFADFLKYEDEYLLLGRQIQQKRDYFAGLMSSTGLTPYPSSGSYFQLYSYSNISSLTETEFAKQLTTEAGVTAIPLSAFYKTPSEHQILRFCFTKKNETLEQAAERLTQYLQHR